ASFWPLSREKLPVCSRSAKDPVAFDAWLMAVLLPGCPSLFASCTSCSHYRIKAVGHGHDHECASARADNRRTVGTDRREHRNHPILRADQDVTGAAAHIGWPSDL